MSGLASFLARRVADAADAAVELDPASGIRLSWPAPMNASGVDRAGTSPARLPVSPSLPMMRGWTLPTPPSIPSLPT